VIELIYANEFHLIFSDLFVNETPSNQRTNNKTLIHAAHVTFDLYVRLLILKLSSAINKKSL